MKEVSAAGSQVVKSKVCINYKIQHIAAVVLKDQIISCALFVRKGVKEYY